MGHEALRQYAQGFIAAFPDIRSEVVRSFGDGNLGVCGTHRGRNPYGSDAGTGRSNDPRNEQADPDGAR